MKDMSQKAVFFDCWDTVISFKEKVNTWNTEPLKKHCRNLKDIDFKELEHFSDEFLSGYMTSHSRYEITAIQFLSLLVETFHIDLDCSIPDCVHEILFYLLPEAMPDIMPFLKTLEKDGIPYAILSNTIYGEKDTFDLVRRLLPEANFQFLLASSHVGIKKPYELFFQTGMRKMSVLPENSIYIGDSFYADVWGANRAKMKNVIWLNPKGKSTERFRPFVEDFDSLKFIECKGYQDVLEKYQRGEIF